MAEVSDRAKALKRSIYRLSLQIANKALKNSDNTNISSALSLLNLAADAVTYSMKDARTLRSRARKLANIKDTK